MICIKPHKDIVLTDDAIEAVIDESTSPNKGQFAVVSSKDGK